MITNPILTKVALPKLRWDIDYYKEKELYFYLKATEKLLPKGRVCVAGYGEMIMLGGYSYLGLIKHPKIDAAAQVAVEKFGTGTHGVRLLSGSLTLHDELEERIADFKQAEAAVTFSSGYVANLTTLSALLRKGDTVICDKLNHASIVDGCLLARAKLARFRHNDISHLEWRLQNADPQGFKLVVADAVFSMDGDIIDLPEVSHLCQKYGAYLMIDEAHSLGVLGETGHGIEEHFGMPADTIDIKMGTLSKTIPAVGGYIASSQKIIEFLKHEARGFVFSAAIPAPVAAAARAAFDVIEEEPQRVERLRANYTRFASKLRAVGFDLLQTETAIVPIVCGSTEIASRLAKFCRDQGVYVQAVVSPVVPEGTARLRACVSAAHIHYDIDYCVRVIYEGGKQLGIIG